MSSCRWRGTRALGSQIGEEETVAGPKADLSLWLSRDTELDLCRSVPTPTALICPDFGSSSSLLSTTRGRVKRGARGVAF